jgi:hypothetical protein
VDRGSLGEETAELPRPEVDEKVSFIDVFDKDTATGKSNTAVDNSAA